MSLSLHVINDSDGHKNFTILECTRIAVVKNKM